MKTTYRNIALAAGLLLTSACASRLTITELMADPSHYDGKTVVTTGQVKNSAGILGYATYQISDGSSTLTVVTNSGGAPRDATKVEVKGKFHTAFSLGTRSLTVLEEQDRKPLRP